MKKTKAERWQLQDRILKGMEKNRKGYRDSLLMMEDKLLDLKICLMTAPNHDEISAVLGGGDVILYTIQAAAENLIPWRVCNFIEELISHMVNVPTDVLLETVIVRDDTKPFREIRDAVIEKLGELGRLA